MFNLPEDFASFVVSLLLSACFGGLVVYVFLSKRRKETIAAHVVPQTSTKPGRKECKMVLCIRTDLGMTKGKITAQCCHATLAAYQDALEKCPEYVKNWERYGQAKITLKVKDEEEMLSLYKNARKKGLVAAVIQDAGKTQIDPGTRTVLAVGPAPIDEVNAVTGHLSLY